MYTIKVPATSANLGVGFDTLGIAFKRYNTFSFESIGRDELVGFEEKYKDHNLVLESYQSFFKEFGLEYQPVKISLISEEVFPSRGLGSSATCIVAGVLGAYLITGSLIPKEKIDTLVTKLEGHPDNVIPALHGGLCASFKTKEGYEYIKYQVSKELLFYALVPDFELKTEVARSVLPKQVSLLDATSNLSYIVNLPYALFKGDVLLLKKLLNDKLQEPYRKPLIQNSDLVFSYFKDLDAALCISGAGPTILVVTKEKIIKKELFGFKVVLMKVSNEGVILDEN